MYTYFSRRQWVILLRRGDLDPGNKKTALGIMIKPVSEMTFSERYRGYRRYFTIGKLYFRTFKRQEIKHRLLDYYQPIQAILRTPEEIKLLVEQANQKLEIIHENLITWYAGQMHDQDGNVIHLRRNPATNRLEPGPPPWPTAPSADNQSS